MKKPGASELPSWISGSVSFTEALSKYLLEKRWFAGKSEKLRSTEVVECIPLESEKDGVFLLLVRVLYASGGEQTYALPLRSVPASEGEATGTSRYLIAGNQETVLSDALENRAFALWLLRAIREGIESAGIAGKLVGIPAVASERLLDAPASALEPSVLRVEQSNTSINYGGRAILKFFRRVEEGINLDYESGRFLTETAHFEHVPPVAGSIEYQRDGRAAATLAILQGFVPNRGDAWKYTLEAVDEYLGRAERAGGMPPAEPAPAGLSNRMGSCEPPLEVRNVIGSYLSDAALLGRRTAELHLALSADAEDPVFAPEGFSPLDRDALAHELATLAGEALRLLREKIPHLDPAAREKASRVVAGWDRMFAQCRRLLDRPLTAQRTRIHGDYHLGQVLVTGNDFVIIDFEGEPERPLAERRSKHSPLRDVAGMLRSFHYASCTALLRRSPESGGPATLTGPLAPWARYWRRWASAEFLRMYFATAATAAFMPHDETELDALLKFFLLQKATYEVIYELRNRPDWLPIPLDGIIELAEE
jgi:trehalose synthase-fused probable maltokinase